jgi:hypothetical protein
LNKGLTAISGNNFIVHLKVHIEGPGNNFISPGWSYVALKQRAYGHFREQLYCSSTGLASAIFKAFPWADVYSSRSERGDDASLFGSITVHGDSKRGQRYVINIYGQLKPGKPSRGLDSTASRLEAFGKALDQIAELPKLKSTGFPYGIGCGLAGGDWEKYESLLKDFAEQVGERGVSVILYRLGQEPHL